MESINYNVIAAASRDIQRIELYAHNLKQKPKCSVVDDPYMRDETGFDYEKGSNKAFFNNPITSYTVAFARKMLKDMKNHDEITIDVNSPGGSANAGITLFNVFSSAPQKVNMRIVGMAYSAASVMVQGADTRRVAPGASIGIHRSWTIGVGNEGEFGDLSNRLRRCDKSILDIYSAVVPMGQMRNVKKYMVEDTSLSGKECVDLGLADAVLSKEELKEAARKEKKAEDKKADNVKPKIKPKAAATPAVEVKAEEEEEQPKPEEAKAECGPHHPDGDEAGEDEEAEEAEVGVEGDDDEGTGEEEQLDDEDEGHEEIIEGEDGLVEQTKQAAEIVAKKKIKAHLAQLDILSKVSDKSLDAIAASLSSLGEAVVKTEADASEEEKPAEAEAEEEEPAKTENKDVDEGARTLAEYGIYFNPGSVS